MKRDNSSVERGREMIAGPIAAEARHILIVVDQEIGGQALEQKFEIIALTAGDDVHCVFPTKLRLVNVFFEPTIRHCEGAKRRSNPDLGSDSLRLDCFAATRNVG
jgi:hypothetical protein